MGFGRLVPLLGLALTVVACGARSEILAPDVEEGAGGDGGGAPVGERACLPSCTVGHACCVGGCDGPAAVTESDCCACLDGEANSTTCPGAACGGGECKQAGAACEDGSECCSHACDYPSVEAEEKSCVII